DEVAEVTVVLHRGHAVKSPGAIVVGMEQNDVRLDYELLQFKDALLQMLKERWIEARSVKIARCSIERIKGRLVRIPCVTLRKNAKANFVERRGRQGLERLLLKCVRLMCPGVASRAKWFVGCAIGVSEMKDVRYSNRPVVLARCFRHDKLSGFSIELRHAAYRFVFPIPLPLRHEPNAIGAITIIETWDLD